jgi:aspartyl-tRNA(Asn)/glutamyl-tRNA(Gln) amidotransferase subunit A
VSEPGDLAFLTIAEASARIARRELSSAALTEACLARTAAVGPALNAFVTVTGDAAREEAARADAELASGRWRGPLHGIPVAVKDNVDVAGVPTTAASAVFTDRVPAEDAEAVRRLREAGAVLLGTLNMHEFAFGTTSLVSAAGPVRNPWAPDRVAGGSSGGSAVAVAAGLCLGALGTDTGGSIRLPAACCGIVGLKPSKGLVSTRGVIPLSWTLDHVGPMTRTVRDAALMLSVLAGFDPRDAESEEIPVGDYAAAAGGSVRGLRVGIVSDFAASDPAVADAFAAALATLGGLGVTFRDVTLDVPFDAYAGVLFPEAQAYHALLVEAARDRYQPVTLTRLGSATFTTAEYIAARREIGLARHTSGRGFPEDCDLLISPTAPIAAPRAAASRNNPTAVPLRHTAAFNLLGCPAISIPGGFQPDGIPLGLQIAAPRGNETTLLALAHAYEQATDWHTRRPNV